MGTECNSKLSGFFTGLFYMIITLFYMYDLKIKYFLFNLFLILLNKSLPLILLIQKNKKYEKLI